MSEQYDTAIIGGGQAGLAMSRLLRDRGREHIVLERGRVGERWRTERWDSLRFQFPNWALELPGYRYTGDDPDGFAHYSEIGTLIEDYARVTAAPVRTETEVVALEENADRGGFVVATADGRIEARRVVLATGPVHRASIPPIAAGLPLSVHQTDPTRYRCPAELPDGAVLVVGSGASGYQIADELHHAGRTVYLSVSRHRRVPRRFLGKDVYWWLGKLGRWDVTIDSFPDRRWPPSTVVTGVNGGYDVDVRQLAADGVIVVGRTVGVADGQVAFESDVNEILTAADDAALQFIAQAREFAATAGAGDLADEDDSTMPVRAADIEPVRSVDLRSAGITTVIWATGYRYEYPWVQIPVFDTEGRPIQRRGVTERPGLYFLGLHWMHTFKSGLFSGVGADAAYIAEHMDRSR
jgi:putative flavoprotein involved in K+ transport